jgi:hypothetical protein
MGKKIFLLSVTAMFLLSSMVFNAAARNANEEALARDMGALQSAPEGSDAESKLRENIIRTAQKMGPSLKVPEEAARRMARASAAVELAKDENGYRKAANEYKEALKAAPWLAEAYYNLGILQEKSGDYSEAIKNLNLYLLARPRSEDAPRVREMIYKIEYKQEESAKGPQASSGGVSEDTRKMVRNLAGKWEHVVFEGRTDYFDLIVIGDDSFTLEYKYPRCTIGEAPATKNIFNMKVRGDTLEGTHTHWTDMSYMGFSVEEKTFPVSGMISDNGNAIIIEMDHPWPSNVDGGRWTLSYGKVRWIFTRAY